MKGGHKVMFNAKNRGIDTSDIPGIDTENYNDPRTTIRDMGYEGDCSCNAFLLLGFMSKEVAIYLAEYTKGLGLGWEYATKLLDAAFPDTTHIWKIANTLEQITGILKSGEATMGAYEGDSSHYFVVFNKSDTIYVVDSWLHISMPYEEYKKRYADSNIFVIDSDKTDQSSSQKITKALINRVLIWNDDTEFPPLAEVSRKQLEAESHTSAMVISDRHLSADPTRRIRGGTTRKRRTKRKKLFSYSRL